MNDSVNTEIRIEVPSLMTYVKEYGESLLRIDAEKELQKAMAEKAESHHSIKPSHFKKAATAYYKDKVKELRDDLGEQLSLLEFIQDE